MNNFNKINMSKASIVSLCKRDILDIYKCAINAVRPELIIKNTVSIKNDILAVKDYTGQREEVLLDLKQSKIHVIGGGKSVLGMAIGIAEKAKQGKFTHLFSHGVLSLPVGLKSSLHDKHTKDLLDLIGVESLFGSNNNLPDDDSIRASEAILSSVVTACHADESEGRQPIFIVLISGGGSACLTRPKHIDLDKKLELMRFLVQRGADIIELNKVRRFFSLIKGGQLASHILKSHPRSQILTLILSDVIGDNIEYIASGPTFIPGENSDCRQSMLEVLEKYNYGDIEKLLDGIDYDAEMSGANERFVTNLVIGNNELALEAAKSKARGLGYTVRCLGNNLQGSSELIVKEIFDEAIRVLGEGTSDKLLVLAGGEATINKTAGQTWGLGGRAQEMALDYIILRMSQELASSDDLTDVFLAGGTDGQDGPTDVAGCLASHSESRLAPTFSRDDAAQAKMCHDSYNFWSRHKPEWLIRTGLTGTNVMDLYLYLVRKHS